MRQGPTFENEASAQAAPQRDRGRGQRRPVTTWVQLVLLGFQGVSGVIGGIGLVADPTGATLGIPIVWLQHSPFADYLIPGWVLLSVLGLGPLAAAWGVWKGHRWGRFAGLLVGIALTIWLAVEIAIVGYQPTPPLQLTYGAVGLILLYVGLRNTTRPR